MEDDSPKLVFKPIGLVQATKKRQPTEKLNQKSNFFKVKSNRMAHQKLATFQVDSESSEDELEIFHKKYTPENLLDQAYASIDSGHTSAAINKFTQILNHPQCNYMLKCKVHDMLAQNLIGLNQLSRAIQHAELGIKISQENSQISEFPYLYQTLARAQRNLGELNLSKINLQKAKEADPNDVALHEELDLEILEIDNLMKKLTPISSQRYGVQGSHISCCHQAGKNGKIPVVLQPDDGVLRTGMSQTEEVSLGLRLPETFSLPDMKNQAGLKRKGNYVPSIDEVD